MDNELNDGFKMDEVDIEKAGEMFAEKEKLEKQKEFYAMVAAENAETENQQKKADSSSDNETEVTPSEEQTASAPEQKRAIKRMNLAMSYHLCEGTIECLEKGAFPELKKKRNENHDIEILMPKTIYDLDIPNDIKICLLYARDMGCGIICFKDDRDYYDKYAIKENGNGQ